MLLIERFGGIPSVSVFDHTPHPEAVTPVIPCSPQQAPLGLVINADFWSRIDHNSALITVGGADTWN